MHYNLSSFKQDLKKAEEWLSREYSQVHTGRATPALLDSVSVDSYGSMMPIKNLASVSIEDPRTLRVSPWDREQVKAMEKAILASNLGFSVAVDESGLRVIFPQLTTETREKIVKVLKEKLEDARVSVRQEREAAWSAVQEAEKQGGMSEDDKFRAKDEIQKLVDETNKNLEAVFAKKQAEVMTQ